MILLLVLRLVLVVGLVALGVSQIVLPLLMGRPVFPLFHTPGRLQRNLTRAREEVDLAGLEHEIASTHQHAEATRRGGGAHLKVVGAVTERDARLTEVEAERIRASIPAGSATDPARDPREEETDQCE